MRLEYFQLIDRIVDLNLDERTIRVEAKIPSSNTIFEGHFPGNPLMPGVLLIEAMAQASGWLIVAAMRFKRAPFLIGVREAKLRRFVVPGQSLSITANYFHEGSGYGVTRAALSADGKASSEAELTFRLAEFPNETFRTFMESWAKSLDFPMELTADG